METAKQAAKLFFACVGLGICIGTIVDRWSVVDNNPGLPEDFLRSVMAKEMTTEEWQANPQVQLVYEILCDTTEPPQERHWEGWLAERIVLALCASSPKP